MASLMRSGVTLLLAVLLTACGGGGSTSNGTGNTTGGGGTFSFAQFCKDLNADSQVLPALTYLPVLTDSAPQETSLAMRTAATKANDLAAEAAPGPGPGLLSKIDIKTTLTDIATELTTDAAKLDNGDAGGYAVNGDLLTHLTVIGTVCLSQFPG